MPKYSRPKAEDQAIVEKKEETMASYLADWFFEQGDHHALEYSDIAIKIAHIKNPEFDDLPPGKRSQELRKIANEMEIDYVRHHVSSAREYLENRYQKTVVNVKGYGYKLATKKEASHFMAQHTSRWLKNGVRIKRGLQAADRKAYKASLQTMMPRVNKLLNDVDRVGTKFLIAYQEEKNKKGEKNGKEEAKD